MNTGVRILHSFVEANPNHVFVEKDGNFPWPDWELVSKIDAVGRDIIKCSQCDNPAAQLDRFWPHYVDYNLCIDCKRNIT